jgi:hypothetical protein
MERRPELAEHIRTCSTRPRVVFDEAHRFSPEVRSDWLQVRIEMVRVNIDCNCVQLMTQIIRWTLFSGINSRRTDT